MTTPTITKILLVEDSKSDARLIKEFLREQSWPDIDQDAPTIEHVSRIETAREMMTPAVDIVLLDLGLPDSSGLGTLETMLEIGGATPVVVLTGLDDERVGVEAVEQGAQDYLVKNDLSPRLLQQTLRYALQRERHQQELQERNETLQQRNAELALLNQIVRHDIRNDVTVILAWSETLETQIDEEAMEYLDRMVNAGEHITNITETVGDFLEVLEGNSDPELRPINLETVLINEVDKARSAHDEATIELAGDHEGGLQVAATELLSSVFRNLLNNAVTHNDKQEPKVEIQVEKDADTVAVRIADNGPGVRDSEKDEIFGRGEMGLDSPGSGIGLYLVDTLVEMYDGTVVITANDPEGSVFTVTLQTYSPNRNEQSEEKTTDASEVMDNNGQ
jgi:signal transduction histidine kinase